MLVDIREKNSLVIAELVGKGIDVEFKTLEIGDYIVGDVVIERKTFRDFIKSMFSKRLIRQIENLCECERKLLILEGIEDYDFTNPTRGMILSIVLDYNIPIIFTKNEEDTANFLFLLEKRIKKEKKEYSLRAKRKMSLKEMQEFFIEGFPGIGPTLAKEMLKNFGNIKNIINASRSELMKIKKLGKKKAEEIKRLVETKYS